MENIPFIEAIIKLVTAGFNLIISLFNPLKKRDKSNVKNDHTSLGIKKDEYIFLLNANKQYKKTIDPHLREWFNSGRKKNFHVKVSDIRTDENIKEIKYLKKIIKRKSTESLERKLTDLEYEYRELLKLNRLKEWAIYFFLNDNCIQNYLNITSIIKLQEYIQNLASFDYFAEKSRRRNNNDYIELEVSIQPKPDICNNYFIAPIKRDDLYKVTSNMRDIPLLEIQDYGFNILLEISLYYYFFLAEEVVIYKNTKISEDQNVLSLLKYSVGIH